VQPADSPATTPELIVLGTAGSYAQMATQAGAASLLFGTGDVSETAPGRIDSVISGAGGTRQLVTEMISPQFTGNPASIQMISQSQDGTVASQINLNCVNRTVLGLSGLAWWSDATSQFNLPVSGGPFIFGESFHGIAGGVNISGTIRVTIVCGSLPDATYYPTQNRHFPLAYGGTPTTVGNVNARVFVPTSGGIQLVVPTMNAANAPFGASIMYPTN
jgi:hypothetical protein